MKLHEDCLQCEMGHNAAAMLRTRAGLILKAAELVDALTAAHVAGHEQGDAIEAFHKAAWNTCEAPSLEEALVAAAEGLD
jgi:hypothetical protein